MVQRLLGGCRPQLPRRHAVGFSRAAAAVAAIPEETQWPFSRQGDRMWCSAKQGLEVQFTVALQQTCSNLAGTLFRWPFT